jgi:hypothetical protein
MSALESARDDLSEAMALLIRNQAAFVEQIARNDQERLALQRRADEHDLKSRQYQNEIEQFQRNTEQWQRKSDEQFMRMEKRLIGFEERLKRIETFLLQLPQLIKKEIGAESQK